MNVIITFVVITVGLFVAAFMTKRRFGLLGLALAAGSVLSTMWNYDAGIFVSSLGFVTSGPLTTALTLSAIVLLPAILLLFHGYTYKGLIGRVVGAALFTLLAVAFLVEPLGYTLSLDGIGASVYKWLVSNKDAIISIGVVAAVADLFFTKPAALHSDKKSKK
jgi:hypothetical protein